MFVKLSNDFEKAEVEIDEVVDKYFDVSKFKVITETEKSKKSFYNAVLDLDEIMSIKKTDLKDIDKQYKLPSIDFVTKSGDLLTWYFIKEEDRDYFFSRVEKILYALVSKNDYTYRNVTNVTIGKSD